MGRRWILIALAVIGSTTVSGATVERQSPVSHARLDAILDIYVRDGLVYYRALQRERGSIDRYVASLDVSLDGRSQAEQTTFWLNAYNALVLRTVIDRYPIRDSAPPFPAGSIRQIPGAFDGRRHRVGGRSLTLDEESELFSEKEILRGESTLRTDEIPSERDGVEGNRHKFREQSQERAFPRSE